MTTICPKCSHVREAEASVPAWQCPACGVAYIKASGSAAVTGSTGRFQSTPRNSTLPWAKIALVVAIVGGTAVALQARRDHRSGDTGSFASLRAKLDAGSADADLVALATSVRPGDVTMYTTTQCPYCAEARGWLRSHAFTFTECDAEVQRSCADELTAHGAKGVPFLIVKGRPMNDGFDSDEFVALLSNR